MNENYAYLIFNTQFGFKKIFCTFDDVYNYYETECLKLLSYYDNNDDLPKKEYYPYDTVKRKLSVHDYFYDYLFYTSIEKIPIKYQESE